MRRRSAREVQRGRGPRPITRRVGCALAASTGILLGALGFEPLAARLAPRHFALDSVSVIGAHRVSVEELVRFSGVAAGTSLTALNRDEVSRRVASHPWIAEARVTTFLPRKLLLAVVERQAAAVAEIGTPASAWLVDATGTPFAPATSLDCEIHATLIGVADAQPGQAHPLLAQGVDIARALGERSLPAARRVQIGGGDPRALPELRLGPHERRVVLGGGDLDAKLDRLSWILKADLPETAAASTIDLRFGDRVILRSDPSPAGDEVTGPRGRGGPSNAGRAG